MTADPTARFATPRVAAGALFATADAVLLVHKTYSNGWDLPGGYVDIGESPAAACEREVREEIGLDRSVRRLLANDWAPNDREGDKILYLFDCGPLGEDESRIRLDGVELDTYEWVDLGKLGDYVMPRLERRIREAHAAWVGGGVVYLEHGRQRQLYQ